MIFRKLIIDRRNSIVHLKSTKNHKKYGDIKIFIKKISKGKILTQDMKSLMKNQLQMKKLLKVYPTITVSESILSSCNILSKECMKNQMKNLDQAKISKP